METENEKLLNLVKGYAEIIDANEKEIKQLKEEIIKLKKQNGGRPKKLTKEEKSSIKMYRVQGKTVKEIAEMFNCSMSTVNRVLSERK